MTDDTKPTELDAYTRLAEIQGAGGAPVTIPAATPEPTPDHKKPEGADFASVDENPTPDPGALAKAGERFIVIRKSYGIKPDPTYGANAQHMRDAGIVVGAYMFPIFHAGAPSAKEQVAAFLTAPGEILPGDLPPTVDVEFTGNGIADTGMTQGQAYTFLLEILAELKKALGYDAMIYTSHVEWCDTNGLGGPKDLGGHDCPLWVKIPYHLAAHRAPDTTPHAEPHLGFASWDKADLYRIPPPWEKSGWILRQYQGDAYGVPGVRQADLDDFNLAYQGDSGPHVMWVQRRLGVDADGKFGPKTTAALVAFQAAHGLKVTHELDLPTFAALARA